MRPGRAGEGRHPRKAHASWSRLPCKRLEPGPSDQRLLGEWRGGRRSLQAPGHWRGAQLQSSGTHSPTYPCSRQAPARAGANQDSQRKTGSQSPTHPHRLRHLSSVARRGFEARDREHREPRAGWGRTLRAQLQKGVPCLPPPRIPGTHPWILPGRGWVQVHTSAIQSPPVPKREAGRFWNKRRYQKPPAANSGGIHLSGSDMEPGTLLIPGWGSSIPPQEEMQPRPQQDDRWQGHKGGPRGTSPHPTQVQLRDPPHTLTPPEDAGPPMGAQKKMNPCLKKYSTRCKKNELPQEAAQPALCFQSTRQDLNHGPGPTSSKHPGEGGEAREAGPGQAAAQARKSLQPRRAWAPRPHLQAREGSAAQRPQSSRES